ncbi:DNA double-strand break repair nuclease [Bacillus phage 043JT007]|nr:DNA double-strand break repair nuclease [Bacillus phage 043JT007]
MSEKRLSAEEKTILGTEQGAKAALMGYLMAERGKCAPAVFNKYATRFGFRKVKIAELNKLKSDIEGDTVLYSIYEKAYQRIIKLEDIPTAFDSVPEMKEVDAFSQITPYVVSNEANNAFLRELRSLQRKGAHMELLFKGLKHHLVEELKGMPRAKYLKTPVPKPRKGDKSLILAFSDWHIGALVFNEDTGGYNFQKLTTQMGEVTEFVLGLVEELDIKHLYIFHVGDVIEHISMRNVNQAFEAEFPATEQIAKGTRLLIDVLKNISAHIHVTFGMVAGNHDRFNGNKNDKVYNDNAVYLILETLIMSQEEFGALPNVTIIDNRADTYEFTQKVAGQNIKVKHGEYEKKKDDQKIPKHIKEEPIDLYIMGHIHTNRFVQEDYSRFHVYTGSTMGANSYSKELNFPTTSASQLAMVLTEGSSTRMFIPIMFDKDGKLA